LTEPTYFERDRYDLPLPLIEVNPNILIGEPAIENSPLESVIEQQRLQQQSIARALTQVLNPLDIRFKFAIQRHPHTQVSTVIDRERPIGQSAKNRHLHSLEYRLWVRCHSTKSLDSQPLAPSLAKTLRNLELQGFQDGIIEFSQSGASATALKHDRIVNWRLKIDLTPPSMRLKHWARWGDVQAIAKLLNFALAPEGIQMSAILKNLTLHIFCTSIDPQSGKSPVKKTTIEILEPLLTEFAPQGIQVATIHGMLSGGTLEEPDVWVYWLDLPALGNPKFSPTPITLAARGDADALSFVLERLLNPDLEQCFEIGGVNLFLLRRQGLLHVMSEAPLCPIQSQVATTVVKVLRQLGLPDIRGVRVHGRISGQLRPLWTYGVDFDREPLELPPVTLKQQLVSETSGTKIGLGERISAYLVATRIWRPQYSMVKTNQLVYQPRFKWEPSLLLLLVGIGLAIGSDFGIKFVLDSKHITTQTTANEAQLSFNNELLEQKLAQYQARCLERGVPDVLIVGSSRALRGINPTILRRSLIDRGYPNPQIYNFGINGATAQVVDIILRQLLTPEQLPKMVIWADGSRAFNSGRTDRTYETIAFSDRYRQLTLTSGLNGEKSSLGQVQSYIQNTYQSIENTFDNGLANISSAYYHRDRLKTWLQARVPLVDRSDPDGQINALDPAASINDRDIDDDGFLALELQFDPHTYFQKYTKVMGDSDGDYTNFQLLGTQDRALQQVVNLLAARKIPLVFVNMPLSDIYLDRVRLQHEREFTQYMQKLMESHQLTFVNMNESLNQEYNRFSDPSHLNQLGAIKVSRYLAEMKLIPWQALSSKKI
jgi:hypothetical protein